MEVWATSGSSEDIQNAINEAENGDSVIIPSGTFDFAMGTQYGVDIPEGVSVFGKGIDKTILQQTLPPDDDIPMFRVLGSSNPFTRISGMTLISYPFTQEANPSTRGIQLSNATDYRVDHCKFINFCGVGIQVDTWAGSGFNRGLIDHCFFDNPYHDDDDVIPITGNDRKLWGYGIIPVCTGYNTDIEGIIGQYDGMENVTYIEDCHFSRTRHAIASNNAAWYVSRYNYFEEPRPEQYGIVDVHGGGRGLEAYHNTVRGCEYYFDESGKWLSLAFLIRGGGGVIFNNDIIDCYVGIRFNEGLPVDNPIHDVYIWNNEMIKDQRPLDDEYLLDNGNQVENTDYFLYEKSGYTPYPYPHPLTIEGDLPKMETTDHEECLRLLEEVKQLQIQGRNEKVNDNLIEIINKILEALT